MDCSILFWQALFDNKQELLPTVPWEAFRSSMRELITSHRVHPGMADRCIAVWKLALNQVGKPPAAPFDRDSHEFTFSQHCSTRDVLFLDLLGVMLCMNVNYLWNKDDPNSWKLCVMEASFRLLALDVAFNCFQGMQTRPAADLLLGIVHKPGTWLLRLCPWEHKGGLLLSRAVAVTGDDWTHEEESFIYPAPVVAVSNLLEGVSAPGSDLAPLGDGQISTVQPVAGAKEPQLWPGVWLPRGAYSEPEESSNKAITTIDPAVATPSPGTRGLSTSGKKSKEEWVREEWASHVGNLHGLPLVDAMLRTGCSSGAATGHDKHSIKSPMRHSAVRLLPAHEGAVRLEVQGAYTAAPTSEVFVSTEVECQKLYDWQSRLNRTIDSMRRGVCEGLVPRKHASRPGGGQGTGWGDSQLEASWPSLVESQFPLPIQGLHRRAFSCSRPSSRTLGAGGIVPAIGDDKLAANQFVLKACKQEARMRPDPAEYRGCYVLQFSQSSPGTAIVGVLATDQGDNFLLSKMPTCRQDDRELSGWSNPRLRVQESDAALPDFSDHWDLDSIRARFQKGQHNLACSCLERPISRWIDADTQAGRPSPGSIDMHHPLMRAWYRVEEWEHACRSMLACVDLETAGIVPPDAQQGFANPDVDGQAAATAAGSASCAQHAWGRNKAAAERSPWRFIAGDVLLPPGDRIKALTDETFVRYAGTGTGGGPRPKRIETSFTSVADVARVQIPQPGALSEGSPFRLWMLDEMSIKWPKGGGVLDVQDCAPECERVHMVSQDGDDSAGVAGDPKPGSDTATSSAAGISAILDEANATMSCMAKDLAASNPEAVQAAAFEKIFQSRYPDQLRGLIDDDLLTGVIESLRGAYAVDDQATTTAAASSAVDNRSTSHAGQGGTVGGMSVAGALTSPPGALTSAPGALTIAPGIAEQDEQEECSSPQRRDSDRGKSGPLVDEAPQRGRHEPGSSGGDRETETAQLREDQAPLGIPHDSPSQPGGMICAEGDSYDGPTKGTAEQQMPASTEVSGEDSLERGPAETWDVSQLQQPHAVPTQSQLKLEQSALNPVRSIVSYTDVLHPVVLSHISQVQALLLFTGTSQAFMQRRAFLMKERSAGYTMVKSYVAHALSQHVKEEALRLRKSGLVTASIPVQFRSVRLQDYDLHRQALAAAAAGLPPELKKLVVIPDPLLQTLAEAKSRLVELQGASLQLLAGLSDRSKATIVDQMTCHAVLTIEAAAAVMEELVKQLQREQRDVEQGQAIWEGDLLNMIEPGSLEAEQQDGDQQVEVEVSGELKQALVVPPLALVPGKQADRPTAHAARLPEQQVEWGSKAAGQPVPRSGQTPARARSSSVEDLPQGSPRVISTDECAHSIGEPSTDSPGMVRRISSLQRQAFERVSPGASGSPQRSPGSSRYPNRSPAASAQIEGRSTARSDGAYGPTPSMTQGGETAGRSNAGAPMMRQETAQTMAASSVVSQRSPFVRQASSGQGFDQQGPWDAPGGYSGAQTDRSGEEAAGQMRRQEALDPGDARRVETDSSTMEDMTGHGDGTDPHGAAPGLHAADPRQGRAYGRLNHGVIDPTKPATGGRRSMHYVDATRKRLPATT